VTICTVTDVFLGIPGDPCGQPAAETLITTCPGGHVEHAPICVFHAFGLGLVPADPGLEVPPMWCPVCAEAGTTTPTAMAVSP
jgi:hypothetical protein